MVESVIEALPAEYKSFRNAVESIARLVMQRNLFPENHPGVRSALESAEGSLETVTGRSRGFLLKKGEDSIRHLNFNLRASDSDERGVHFLFRALEKMSVGEIEFGPSTSEDELLAFAEIAGNAVRGVRDFDYQSAWRRIRSISIRHRAGSSAEDPARAPVTAREIRPCRREKPVKGREGGGALIEELLADITEVLASDGKIAAGRIFDLLDNRRGAEKTVLLLKSLKGYDDYTFDHSVNVAVLSAAIARRLGYSEDETEAVGMAALMHDIGKLYVPKHIIHKTGRLTPDEWQAVKRHPVDGERILKEEGAEFIVYRVAYEHHMRYDMKGYPSSFSGGKCLEASHIVRISDSYDALTTRRPYRKQINPFEAVKMMEKARGSEFHPGYFDVFMSMLGNVPIGSVLRLSGGEQVITLEVGEEGAMPRARIIADAQGNSVDDGPVLDLSDIDGRTGRPLHEVAGISVNPVRDIRVGKYLAGRR